MSGFLARIRGTARAQSLAAPTHGFYGKLPSRGDFVGAGLPRAFLDPWTQAVAHGMLRSQSRLGKAFAPAWRAAPLWYFVLAPGLAGRLAAAGWFCPSVDRVGRQYPLTVAALFEALAAAPDVAVVEAWLRATAAPATQAVAEDCGPDALTDMLAASPPPMSPAGGVHSVFWTDGAPNVPGGGAGVRLEVRDVRKGMECAMP